jgi:hypothetical protein
MNTEIIAKYETHRNEIVTPLWNKLAELRLSIGANPANHYSDNAEYIEISAKYDEAVKISNAMYAEYKVETSTPEYKRAAFVEKMKKLGKIMNSNYAGKSSLTGKTFSAGEKIWYGKWGGVSYTVLVSEIENV